MMRTVASLKSSQDKKFGAMMNRTVAVFLALAVVGGMLVTADTLVAQSDQNAVVKERQDLMGKMSKSWGPLAAIWKGESFDLAAGAAAAETMHDSIVEATTLFPAETAKGEVAESRAKPEVWTERAAFEAAANRLIEESARLVEAANSGDVQVFIGQLQNAADACNGCHEGNGNEGGKFRFPKEN